jgi:hypothetical protein
MKPPQEIPPDQFDIKIGERCEIKDGEQGAIARIMLHAVFGQTHLSKGKPKLSSRVSKLFRGNHLSHRGKVIKSVTYSTNARGRCTVTCTCEDGAVITFSEDKQHDRSSVYEKAATDLPIASKHLTTKDRKKCFVKMPQPAALAKYWAERKQLAADKAEEEEDGTDTDGCNGN